jgi:hypothetical protein
MIQRLRDFQRASHPARTSVLLGALIGAVGLAKYGLVMWPGWTNLFEVTQNWQDPTVGSLVQPPQDYVLANAVPNVILGALHLGAQPVYVSIQVALAFAAVVLPFLMPVVRESAHTSRLAFTMLAGGPALALLLTWIGGYDTICVIGATLAVLSRNRWSAAAGWLIFAVGHSSLALITFACWGLLMMVGQLVKVDRDFIARIFLGVGGIVVGSGIVWAATESWGGITSRLEAFQLYALDYYVNAWIAGMPLILFSALGVGWIVLLDKSLRRSRAVVTLLAIALVIGIALPLVALDETRTLAIVLTPLVLAWVGSARRLHSDEAVQQIWSRYGIAAVIVPIVIVGSGQLLPFGFQSILYWRANF